MTKCGSALSGTVTKTLEPHTWIMTVGSGWAKESKGGCNPYLLTEVCTVHVRVGCSREARTIQESGRGWCIRCGLPVSCHPRFHL